MRATLDGRAWDDQSTGMEISELTRRAVELRARFAAAAVASGREPWTRAELAQGFVGDVGALMKLSMVADGRRDGPADVQAKLAHELADCLWSVLVLAEAHGVDLEKAFVTMIEEVDLYQLRYVLGVWNSNRELPPSALRGRRRATPLHLQQSPGSNS
jgi:hypothetical protein